MLRIGIDVGGTFTDLVAVDPAGRTTLAKSASTPPDPSVGVLNGLAQLAEALGLDLAGLLAGTTIIEAPRTSRQIGVKSFTTS